jgi:hypothetical protein
VLVDATDSSDTQWELREKHHVVGDRATAVSRAEEICRTWSPRGWEPEERSSPSDLDRLILGRMSPGGSSRKQ